MFTSSFALVSIIVLYSNQKKIAHAPSLLAGLERTNARCEMVRAETDTTQATGETTQAVGLLWMAMASKTEWRPDKNINKYAQRKLQILVYLFTALTLHLAVTREYWMLLDCNSTSTRPPLRHGVHFFTLL